MPEITRNDIDSSRAAEVALRQVGIFTTYDVSRDAAMLARHGAKASATMYHALVGKELAALRTPQGQPLLVNLGKRKVGTSQAAVWRLAQVG